MNRLFRSSRFRWSAVAMLVLLAYVGSYADLSRRGLAWSKSVGADGVLYFFPPEDTDSWRAWNYGCVTFYYPLIAMEMWLGTVKGIGCVPLWRLSQDEDSDGKGTPLASHHGGPRIQAALRCPGVHKLTRRQVLAGWQPVGLRPVESGDPTCARSRRVGRQPGSGLDPPARRRSSLPKGSGARIR